MSASLAFRLDDPSPTSDHALERRILAVFARHRVPLTVAVVPYAARGAAAEMLAASPTTMPHLAEAHVAGDIELALHGHSHLDRAPPGLGPSECRGVPRDIQCQLLAAGRACLSSGFGTPIDGFVPPWNSFDANTLHAAAECGFDYLSAGDLTPSNATAVTTIPRTCRLDRLAPALTEAARFANCAPAIVVVLHPDNFVEFRAPPDTGEEGPITDLTTLDALLGRITASGADYRCLTLSALVAERRGQAFWWRRDAGWLARLPDRIRMRLPRYLAFSSSRARVLWRAMQGESTS